MRLVFKKEAEGNWFIEHKMKEQWFRLSQLVKILLDVDYMTLPASSVSTTNDWNVPERLHSNMTGAL